MTEDEQPIQVMGALLCQDRFEDAKRHIFRVLPHVDHYVIVDNGSGPEMQAWLRNFARVNVEVIFRRWNDSFADARNTYLAVAERLANEHPDQPVFIAAADDDELYSDDLLTDLHKIARRTYIMDCNVLRPFSMNADLDWKGDRVAEWRGGYYKPLMFVWEPGMRYEDAPGHFHEDMKIASGWRVHNLDDEQGKYYYCVAPETRVLCADLTWRPAGNLRFGDKLVAFDEEAVGCGRGRGRRYRTAEVLSAPRILSEALRIQTDKATVVCSENHRWLIKVGTNPVWRAARQLKPGDKIVFLDSPWETEDTREAGWLAGLLDGEGSISRGQVRFGQNPGPILDGFLAGLAKRGFRATVVRSRKRATVHVTVCSSPNTLRLLGTLRPERLLNSAERLWVGHARSKPSEAAEIQSIVSLGQQEVVALHTSTGTFIAEGLLSHNSHVKRLGETWLRATRNFFAGGGGPNLGERNPLWKPFRELFARQGVFTSDQMQRYLRVGGIDNTIKRWFIRYRHFGTERDPTPPMWTEWPDGTSEVREGFLAYFVFLRPEEMPTNVREYDRTLGIDYAKDIRIIHGPAAPDWATAQ